MKFRAERTEFAEAAAWALRTVGARATLPALSGVHLEVAEDRLTLRSTDYDLESELSIPVQADRDGTALVPGRLLGDVVRTLPNAAISAEVSDDLLHLRCGRASFNLRLLPNAEDFPAAKVTATDAAVAVMKADDFARTVAQVARAATFDDPRPYLNGVLLEASGGSLTAAATDSYRLAVRTVPWDQGAETTALVPRRALEEARRSAESLGSEVRLVIEPLQVTFAFGDRRLTSRLIEAKFPSYQPLIPTGFDRRLVVDRAELEEVVRRVAIVGESTTNANRVMLNLTADTVLVTADSGEVGRAEEALPGELEGEPLEIAFNPRFLTDGLDAAGGERVVLEFRDVHNPAVIRPVSEDDGEASGDFLYLLMPVRV
jgi:DNA polymerase III subunit beta